MVADPDLVKALQEGPQRLPGFEQGRLAARLTWRLAQFAEESGLGEVYTAETGFLLAPDRGGVHIPVLSFIRRERLDGEMVKGFRIGAPDLVAEIRTASASPVEKARAWLAAGTRAVLVLDPAARTVTLYQGRAARKVFGADEVLTIPDVVPGWELPVRNLFD
jgi:Uma2 family endonuclease